MRFSSIIQYYNFDYENYYLHSIILLHLKYFSTFKFYQSIKMK